MHLGVLRLRFGALGMRDLRMCFRCSLELENNLLCNLSEFHLVPSCYMGLLPYAWYFVLTAADLEAWYQNPESFNHEQDLVLWSEKLRPCAEALYIVLLENHSQESGNTDAFNCAVLDMVPSEIQKVEQWKQCCKDIAGTSVGDAETLVHALSERLHGCYPWYCCCFVAKPRIWPSFCCCFWSVVWRAAVGVLDMAINGPNAAVVL
ncbi:hypothetical protein U1Q18_020702 [Sarracenia purpurea var. burkii]